MFQNLIHIYHFSDMGFTLIPTVFVFPVLGTYWKRRVRPRSHI